MNSLTNLTSAKVRRFFLIAALVICPFLAVQNGNAQPPMVTANLFANTNMGGPFNSSTITITQNQQFFLQLQITTNFISSGITYFLQSNNGSGLFRITARMWTMQGGVIFPYPDPTTGDATLFTGNNSLLDPVNNHDLGATNNGEDTDPAGTYTIAILTIDTMNAPVGQYTIFTDRGIVTDRTGGNFDDRAFTAMATINVIPEPTTVGLAVIGGGMLLVAGYRKHRRSKAA
jgi:hypothetical protein